MRACMHAYTHAFISIKKMIAIDSLHKTLPPCTLTCPHCASTSTEPMQVSWPLSSQRRSDHATCKPPNDNKIRSDRVFSVVVMVVESLQQLAAKIRPSDRIPSQSAGEGARAASCCKTSDPPPPALPITPQYCSLNTRLKGLLGPLLRPALYDIAYVSTARVLNAIGKWVQGSQSFRFRGPGWLF
jgi:hypothetical protein